MKRRSLLYSIALSIPVSGCLGDSTDGFESQPTDTAEPAADDEPTLEGPLHELRDGIEAHGLAVKSADVRPETIEMVVQTSGDAEADIASIAGAYATMAPHLERDLLVRLDDRGLTVETFEIEREWALAFVEGEQSDGEYLSMIDETRT
ncbi:MAG: hypothetical protein ACQETB_07340 [Halobacteriota archaeon]